MKSIYNKSKEEIIKKHINFIYMIVNHLINKDKNLASIRNDLVSAGIEGLLIASRKFDEEKNVNLLTYASYYIKNKIYSEVNNFYNKGLKKNPKRGILERKISELTEINKDIEQIAEELNLSSKSIERTLANKITTISLDDKVSDNDENYTIGESIPSDFSVEKHIEREIDLERLRRAIKFAMENILDERERLIIENRFLKDTKMTLDELSKIFNVSRERIRQIESIALKKMYVYMKAKNITPENFLYY